MRIPYPHVERAVVVVRPALVLTPRAIGPAGLLIWAAMITNGARTPWPGDLAIGDWEKIGLLIPSVVRTAKIVAAETTSATLIGKLKRTDLRQVREKVALHLGY